MIDARACYRALARLLLPRPLLERAGQDLEDAAVACIVRERTRFGAIGVALAWGHLVTDTVVTAIKARRRHAADARLPPPSPPERGALTRMIDTLLQDLRYAIRGLRRQPGFTAITVLTLALGIGANTAIFSVVSGVLLRPLPYPESDQLQFITGEFEKLGFSQFTVSTAEYLEFRDHNASFSSVGAYAADAANLGTDPPIRSVVASVTPEFMPTLGIPPALGRWFTAEDAADSARGPVRAVILSHELWQRAYHGDPAILERTVAIDDVPTRIVGVMPPGYDIHDQKVELWAPMGWTPADVTNGRGSHYMYMVGRLKKDVTVEQARADLAGMMTRWDGFVTDGGKNEVPSVHKILLGPLKEDLVGGVRRAVLTLQGAVVFVLLIACANLANLQLARADGRRREFAVRGALGAGRRRLLAQFVTEGLVLASIGAAAGAGLAWLGLGLLLRLNPDALPRFATISLDWRVLGFTLLLAAVTGVLFGLAPMLQAREHLAPALRDGARTTGTRVQRLARASLVVGEITFAVLLVVGAGLLLRSFVNLMKVDLGFERSQLTTFQVVLPVIPNLPTPDARIAQRERISGFFTTLQERLSALPGVTSVTTMSGLPPNRPVDANLTDFEWIPDVTGDALGLSSRQYPPENVDYWNFIGTGYAETMGIPVLKGRSFAASDVGGPPVVLINEALAKRFFADRDPIGQHVKPGKNPKLQWFTVVGVLKDVKQGGVDTPAGTELFLLQPQLPRILYVLSSMSVVVRSTSPTESLAGPIREIVRELNPTVPIAKLRPMDDVIGEALARPRLLAVLLGVFALLALTLAAIGTYGVLSYLVTRQRQEIGVRMALGANREEILRHFLMRGLRLAALGLALGLAGSFLLTRLIRTLLFGVDGMDPMTLALVTVVIGGVAIAACLIPAWRAARVDPLTVLRPS